MSLWLQSKDQRVIKLPLLARHLRPIKSLEAEICAKIYFILTNVPSVINDIIHVECDDCSG